MEVNHLCLVLGVSLCFFRTDSLGIYKLGNELIVNGNMEYDNWDSDYQWFGYQATVTQVPGVVGNAAAVTEKASQDGQLNQHLVDDRALGAGYYYMEGYIKILNHPEGADWFDMEMQYRYRDKDSVAHFVKVGEYPRLKNTDGWVKIAGEFLVPLNSTKQKVVFRAKYSADVNFAVDEVSLKQIIPDGDWEAAANEMIDENRKGEVNVNVNINYNLDPSFVTFRIRQLSHDFKLGAGVNPRMINGSSTTEEIRQRYQNYIYDNFKSATPSRAFRWKGMEKEEGVIDLAYVDKAVYSLDEQGLDVVAESLFWDNANFGVPEWFDTKSPTEKVALMNKHVTDMVGRFGGKIDTWIVSRDSLRSEGYFPSVTDDYEIVEKMFDWMEATNVGGNFVLADSNVLRESTHTSALVHQASKLKNAGHSIQLGAQGAFESTYTVDPIQLMARLDILAQAGIPILVTHLAIQRSDVMERAQDLETFLRVAFAHPNVESITLTSLSDCCGDISAKEHSSLVETDFYELNKAGWTLSRLFKKEWRTDGFLTLPEKYLAQQTASFRAFFGEYEMDVLVDDTVVETRKFSVHKGVTTDINVDINE